MSIQFGSMTAGQLVSYAPDYVKAKLSAGRILDLFDRVPPIDSYSQEGLKVRHPSWQIAIESQKFYISATSLY